MIINANHIMEEDPLVARLPHDARFAQGAAFAGGRFMSAGEVTIPLFDMGLIHADATYEKATVARGRYFRLQDHFDRFAQSCSKFRLTSPYSPDEMAAIFDALLCLTGLKEAGVWWCVTRGRLTRASDRGRPQPSENRFYAIVSPYTSIATAAQRQHGLDLLISKNHIRTPARAIDPTAKNFNWMDFKMSLFEARDSGKDFSVLTDAEGYLTECPGANIFIVQDGTLYTPDSGCLKGITRRSVLDLAAAEKISGHEQKVHSRQLLDADEAFITSSAGGVMAVNSVDGIVLGGRDGPGMLTARLHNLYWERMWEGWKGSAADYTSAPAMAERA